MWFDPPITILSLQKLKYSSSSCLSRCRTNLWARITPAFIHDWNPHTITALNINQLKPVRGKIRRWFQFEGKKVFSIYFDGNQQTLDDPYIHTRDKGTHNHKIKSSHLILLMLWANLICHAVCRVPALTSLLKICCQIINDLYHNID